jgi:2-haloacid dehalogenase
LARTGLAGPPRPAAVVFDIGNVIVRWHPRFLYRHLIADPVQLDWFVTYVVSPEWHFQHDAGVPMAESMALLAARFPEQAALIGVYKERWLETIDGAIEGTVALIEALDAAGVPLFAISNFSAEVWQPFVAAYPVIRRFRDVVVSGAVGLVKPDPQIYTLALARFGLAANTALFIDDREENIAAAIANGFLGHHFTTAEALADDLARHQLI